MFRRLSTDTLNWILLIGAVLFILEFVFFSGAFLIVSIFFGILMYIGWRNFQKTWGIVCFWAGAISLFISLMNTMAARFLVVAGAILFLLDYYRSRKQAETFYPAFQKPTTISSEKLLKIKPLFDHRFLGHARTKEPAYQWSDLNLFSIYGNKVIDLSRTVLPDDTAVIAIRQIIGDIEILIPYEVEVSIHHSSIFGRASIFGEYHGKLMNAALFYQTEHYQDNKPRVKIITSLLSGDIEVKRI